MRTRLGTLAAHLAESGWLAALVVVPIFFNVRTVRIFEEEKIPLLRSIAVLVLFALLVWIVEERPWAELRRALRPALCKAVALLAAAWLAASWLSVAPRVSFWGAYIRAQGSLTLLAYLTIFLAVVLLVRRREQLDRIVSVVLLASLPPALYGAIQRFGSDPILWILGSSWRPHSTAGNAIFVSAFLIMIVPLTLAKIAAAWRAAPAAGDSKLRRGIRIGALALLLLCQLAAIVFSESRGPMLGLIAGMTVFGFAAAWLRRSLLLLLATSAAASATIGFLFVFNLPQGPFEGWKDVAYVERFGAMAGERAGSTQVRLLVWENAAELIAADGRRALTGYGPDTMGLAMRPYLSPLLGHYERHNISVDRAHNELFDAWIATGVAGLAAEVGVFVGLFFLLLHGLGLLAGGRQRWGFALLLAAFAAAGGAGCALVDGRLRLVPVGFAGGVLCALAGWIALRFFSEKFFAHPVKGESPAVAAGHEARNDAALLVALLGGIVAHFTELQTGIAVVATRLYFWVYAALALVVVRRLLAGDLAAEGSQRRPAPLLEGSLLTIVPTVGLVLIILTANFYQAGLDLGRHGLALAILFGGVWLFGAVLVAAEPGVRRDGPVRLAAYAATTAGLCLLFVAACRPWVSVRPIVADVSAARAGAHAATATGTVFLVYAAVLFVLALHAAIEFSRRDDAALPWRRSPRFACAAYLGLGLAASLAFVAANVTRSRADVASKHGAVYEQLERWPAAVGAHREAVRLQPEQDQYRMNLGRAWMERARRAAAGSDEQRRGLERARRELNEARRLAPLDPDHTRNLARLYRLWSNVAPDEEERARHAERALEEYARLIEEIPRHPAAWNEQATFFLDRGELERALPALDRALDLDDRYPTTLWLRANTYAALQRYEEAVADYDRALAVDPYLLAAQSGKASALARLGRFDEALGVSRATLEFAPHDPVTRYNLVLLHRQRGQREEALREARAALEAVRKKHQDMFEELVEELEAEEAKGERATESE